MKGSGKIGFWLSDVEIKPSVYKSQIIEKPYIWEIINNIRRFQQAENQQNDNLVLNNRLSIISDLFLQTNWPSIKYVLWNNVKWKVNSVDISSYPRVILELGGVYNGKNASG